MVRNQDFHGSGDRLIRRGWMDAERGGVQKKTDNDDAGEEGEERCTGHRP